MLFADKSGLIIPTAFAVFSHEAAHIIAMNVLAVAPKEIVLIPGSIKIIKRGLSNLRSENIILFAGSLINLLFFAAFYGVGYFLDNIRLMIYGVVQLVIGVFNLLPAKGLDGGSLLYNIVFKYKSESSAETAVKISSLGVVFLLVFVGTFMLIGGSVNLSFYIIALYILIFSVLKN